MLNIIANWTLDILSLPLCPILVLVSDPFDALVFSIETCILVIGYKILCSWFEVLIDIYLLYASIYIFIF